ncbi:hypothetical protein GGR57DRAFT_178302 [Xylariaceae sp. FL1272]|nr:hypothetical protein GGR57DRAFT_178302 [Xylariaceae sp. FL1272]
MAPIRRYLRISKYSVLECRIYLDNPALVHTWLLNPRKNILPRVIESVRPYVLPKLREERERSRNKRSGKKKGIKDVVVQDEFEVSIFLTETSTRHSIVTKHKHFHDTTQTKLKSNSGRLIAETNDAPVDVDAAPFIRQEDSDDDDAAVALADIPAIHDTTTTRPKRARSNTTQDADVDPADADHNDDPDNHEIISDDDENNEDDDGLFVQSPADDNTAPPPAKRRKAADKNPDDAETDDKKKMAMDISYEGFSIYGRVLCLVVKRRDTAGPDLMARGGNAAATGGPGSNAAKAQARGGGQAMMENFIISTQVPAGTDGSP